MYLLNTLVMPELQSLKQVYSNTGATAANVSQQLTPYEKYPNNL